MSVETTATDQMLQYTWGIAKITLRFTGKGAASLCALLKAKWDARPLDGGLVSMHKIHTSTQSAQVVGIPTASLEQFGQLCRKYNTMYAAITDRQHPDRTEIMVRGEDISIINRVFEECGILDQTEKGCQVKTVAREEINRDARKKKTKDTVTVERPQSARTQGDPSARGLTLSKSEKDKPSVKEQLNEFAEYFKKTRPAKQRRRAPRVR